MLQLLAGNPLLYIKILGVVAVLVFCTYRGYEYGKLSQMKETNRIEQEYKDEKFKTESAYTKSINREIARNNTISRALEVALERKDATAKEIITRIEKEIVDRPVYLECIVPSSGMSILGEISERYNRERKEDDTSKPATKVQPDSKSK